MLLRTRFHFAKLAKRFDHHRHDLMAFLDVGHFTSAEQDADLHFIFVLQELFRPTDLRANVFFPGLGAKTNFLGLGMRLTSVLFLVLVVLILAVIHDSADRRSLVRRHLDKIQACIASPFEGDFSGNDPQLLAFFAHNPDGRDADIVVNAY